MLMLSLLFLMTLFVAYSNGANDNFKGVATLVGSNTTTHKSALKIATIATLAGGLSSIFLAEGLIKMFSGKGLVPDVVATSPEFLVAVAAGAAVTVILATVRGFPVSTTHGLTGALVGAGFVAAGSALNLSKLGSSFVVPLLLGPIVAICLTVPLYRFLHAVATRFQITRETCVCVGAAEFVPVHRLQFDAGLKQYRMSLPHPSRTTVVVGSPSDCVVKYKGNAFGMPLQRLVDAVHYVSAASVSFARGLNDTPKILALLMIIHALNIPFGVTAIAAAMAVGGVLNSRKVAKTMSKDIARMNDGQAVTANVVTAFVVILGSRFGLPLSTTHVSVGAITGVGLVNGTANKGVLSGILLSWVLTLPLAALISGVAYIVARSFA
jgi:inorganic phosphate transporter, PiT family